MKEKKTIEAIENFTDKYVYNLPKLTVAEYVVITVVCLYILRRIS